ncbi:MAG: PAS domain-containing protein [Neisseriaceae bacterium]
MSKISNRNIPKDNKISIVTRVLSSKDEIENACALLYDTYIKNTKYKIIPNNPSGLKIEIRNTRKILVDNFTDSSIWFGAFDGNMLIGCARIYKPEEREKFEFEYYNDNAIVSEYLSQIKPPYVEMSKIVISSKYKNKLIIITHILLAVFNYCKENGESILTFLNNHYLKLLFNHLKFSLILEHAFKYDVWDASLVSFYFANYKNGEVSNIINKLDLLKNKSKYINVDISETLGIVAPMLPILIYWYDKKGTLLGANEHYLKNTIIDGDNIIGTNPYNFYPEDVAKYILESNETVMRTGEVLSQETAINDNTGEYKVFLTTKSPLYDNYGNVIGVIGSAINITDQKEKERLELENYAYIIKEKENEKFRRFIKQMAHDIQLSITKLENIINNCWEKLSSQEQSSIKVIISKLIHLTEQLLSQYNTNIDYYLDTKLTLKDQFSKYLS